MTLQERISADMKEAMKAKDKVRLAALRDIKSRSCWPDRDRRRRCTR